MKADIHFTLLLSVHVGLSGLGGGVMGSCESISPTLLNVSFLISVFHSVL